jgi:hypothetical protein
MPKRFSGLTASKGYIDRKGKNVEAPVVRYTAKGKSLTQAFLLLPVEKNETPQIHLDQVMEGNSVTINLKSASGNTKFKLTLSHSPVKKYSLSMK